MGNLVKIFRPPSDIVVRNGLIFPSSMARQALDAVSFNFTGSALVPHAPTTYIFRSYYVQQPSYYTTFFWASRFNNTFAGDAAYYGCHPFPSDGTTSDTNHIFEISMDFSDYPFTPSSPGNAHTVSYGRWYTQAVVADESAGKVHIDYYYDLDAGLGSVLSYTSTNTWASSGSDVLMFGDNPWSASDSEAASQTFRGLQIYSAVPDTLANMVIEASNDTLNSSLTSWGATNVWYKNQNLKPTDIGDKSGKGHHPAWTNANRPTLYTA